jgi:hypothetical protein
MEREPCTACRRLASLQSQDKPAPFRKLNYFVESMTQKFLLLELGAGVPLRYDGAKTPPVGESLSSGMYKDILSLTR